MSTYSGIGVSPGRVVGPVLRMAPPVTPPEEGTQRTRSAQEEAAALTEAAATVKAHLRARAEQTSGDAQAVLEASALMATDPMLLKSATKLIDEGAIAELAIWKAAQTVATQLANLGGYMAERVHDVFDVRARIVAALRGIAAPGIPESTQPFVLVAEDLAPADTATLDPAQVLALVTSDGGPQSHTAIIARALGLPAVVAAKGVLALEDGTSVFADGRSGQVVSEPGEQLRQAAQAWAQSALSSESFAGEAKLADGYSVPLLANVGTGEEARAAAKAYADGIGLFRTEFLFLEREDEPGEEEQVQAYKEVFAAFPEKKVIVRTLDAGADKPLPFLTNSSEPNPALGARGFRTELNTPGVLMRQLRAIAKAAAQSSAQVWVMAPMVSTAQEAKAFAQMCAEVGLETPGVMIEVPAAAINADKILNEVDFASLGTNDLTQYTMAADRQLGVLAEFNDPWQPAVLAMVELSVRGARAQAVEAKSPEAKPVGVCGEAAADPGYAVVLCGLGVNTLSMTARALAPVAATLAKVSLPEAQEIARLALAAGSAAQARAVVRAQLPILDELGL